MGEFFSKENTFNPNSVPGGEVITLDGHDGLSEIQSEKIVAHLPPADAKTIDTPIPELNLAWKNSCRNGHSQAHRIDLYRNTYRFFQTIGQNPKPIVEITEEEAWLFKEKAISPKPDKTFETLFTHKTTNKVLSAIRNILNGSGHRDKAKLHHFGPVSKNNHNIPPERKMYWVFGPKHDLEFKWDYFKDMFSACEKIGKAESGFFNSRKTFPAYKAQLCRVMLMAAINGLRRNGFQHLRYDDVKPNSTLVLYMKGGIPEHYDTTYEFYTQVQKLKELEHKPEPKTGYEDCLFLTNRGTLMSESRVQDYWKEMVVAAGLDPRLDTMEIRTHAILYTSVISSPEIAQSKARHKGIKTTEGYCNSGMRRNPEARFLMAKQIEEASVKIEPTSKGGESYYHQ